MRQIDKYEKDYIDKENLANEYEQQYQIKYRQQIVNQQIEKYSPKSVLEVGCGMDSQFLHLKDIPETYVIVEPAKTFFYHAINCISDKSVIMYNEMLEDCREELRQYNFDFIIIGSLLHEIENVNEFFEILKEITCEKTIVHINVPNANSFHRLLAVESGLIEHQKTMSQQNITMQQNRIFDMDELCQLVLNNNGSILDKGSYAFKPFSHKQMMELIKKEIISEQVLDGFNICSHYFEDYGSEIFVNFRF